MHTTTSRMITVLATTLGVGLALSGCAASDEPAAAPTFGVTASPTAPAAAHWSYEGEDGPDNWGELSASYASCETGTEQSPIDLSEAQTVAGDDLRLDYGVISEHVTDTGHTFQLAADGPAGVDYDGRNYSLVQMHFHDPSEHTIDGVAAPVEFHFLNTDPDGNLLVIGVLATEGEDNDAYDAFIDATVSADSDAVSGTVDLAAMLPESTDHFSYSGSLTTPPCTEGVQWIVMQTPVELGADQIADLQGAYDHNSRPVQPVGDRAIGFASVAG